MNIFSELADLISGNLYIEFATVWNSAFLSTVAFMESFKHAMIVLISGRKIQSSEVISRQFSLEKVGEESNLKLLYQVLL